MADKILYGKGETLAGRSENKNAPAYLFSAGAMAQPEVSGILRRKEALSLRAGNQHSSIIQGGMKEVIL